jgi:endonuclease III
MANELLHQIATLLLQHRAGKEEWGEISSFEGKPCPKKVANKFLLCCLLDWQMRTNLPWQNGQRLVEDILGDPEDVWRKITAGSQEEWESKHSDYKLHRFPSGHNRLWRIGKDICDRYDGDAGRIWEGRESAAVLVDFLALGAGEQISRMIVGALCDCRQIKGPGDVKADVHVCRVLGRVAYGKEISAPAATELARQLNPNDPWQLDRPLWQLGKDCCKPTNPDCDRCYLAAHCAYNLRRVAAPTPIALPR